MRVLLLCTTICGSVRRLFADRSRPDRRLAAILSAAANKSTVPLSCTSENRGRSIGREISDQLQRGKGEQYTRITANCSENKIFGESAPRKAAGSTILWTHQSRRTWIMAGVLSFYAGRIKFRAIRLAETDAQRAVLHLLSGAADDDVPVRAVLFQLRSGNRLEIHHDRFQHLALGTIARYQAVTFVGRMPLNQHLGGDEPMAGFADGEMNMRAAERSLKCVLDRPDGAKEVLSLGVRYKPAVALKIGVVSAGISAAGVKVGAVNVGLPDLDIAVARGWPDIVRTRPEM